MFSKIVATVYHSKRYFFDEVSYVDWITDWHSGNPFMVD